MSGEVTVNFCTDGAGALLALDPDALYVLQAEEHITLDLVEEIMAIWPVGFRQPLVLDSSLRLLRVATEQDSAPNSAASASMIVPSTTEAE